MPWLEMTKITDLEISKALVDKTYIVDKETALLEGEMLWALPQCGVDVVRILGKHNIDFGSIVTNYAQIAGLESASPVRFKTEIDNMKSETFNEKALPIYCMLGDTAFNKNKEQEFEELVIRLIKDK